MSIGKQLDNISIIEKKDDPKAIELKIQEYLKTENDVRAEIESIKQKKDRFREWTKSIGESSKVQEMFDKFDVRLYQLAGKLERFRNFREQLLQSISSPVATELAITARSAPDVEEQISVATALEIGSIEVGASALAVVVPIEPEISQTTMIPAGEQLEFQMSTLPLREEKDLGVPALSLDDIISLPPPESTTTVEGENVQPDLAVATFQATTLVAEENGVANRSEPEENAPVSPATNEFLLSIFAPETRTETEGTVGAANLAEKVSDGAITENAEQDSYIFATAPDEISSDEPLPVLDLTLDLAGTVLSPVQLENLPVSVEHSLLPETQPAPAEPVISETVVAVTPSPAESEVLSPTPSEVNLSVEVLEQIPVELPAIVTPAALTGEIASVPQLIESGPFEAEERPAGELIMPTPEMNIAPVNVLEIPAEISATETVAQPESVATMPAEVLPESSAETLENQQSLVIAGEIEIPPVFMSIEPPVTLPSIGELPSVAFEIPPAVVPVPVDNERALVGEEKATKDEIVVGLEPSAACSEPMLEAVEPEAPEEIPAIESFTAEPAGRETSEIVGVSETTPPIELPEKHVAIAVEQTVTVPTGVMAPVAGETIADQMSVGSELLPEREILTEVEAPIETGDTVPIPTEAAVLPTVLESPSPAETVTVESSLDESPIALEIPVEMLVPRITGEPLLEEKMMAETPEPEVFRSANDLPDETTDSSQEQVPSVKVPEIGSEISDMSINVSESDSSVTSLPEAEGTATAAPTITIPPLEMEIEQGIVFEKPVDLPQASVFATAPVPEAVGEEEIVAEVSPGALPAEMAPTPEAVTSVIPVSIIPELAPEDVGVQTESAAVLTPEITVASVLPDVTAQIPEISAQSETIALPQVESEPMVTPFSATTEVQLPDTSERMLTPAEFSAGETDGLIGDTLEISAADQGSEIADSFKGDTGSAIMESVGEPGEPSTPIAAPTPESIVVSKVAESQPLISLIEMVQLETSAMLESLPILTPNEFLVKVPEVRAKSANLETEFVAPIADESTILSTGESESTSFDSVPEPVASLDVFTETYQGELVPTGCEHSVSDASPGVAEAHALKTEAPEITPSVAESGLLPEQVVPTEAAEMVAPQTPETLTSSLEKAEAGVATLKVEPVVEAQARPERPELASASPVSEARAVFPKVTPKRKALKTDSCETQDPALSDFWKKLGIELPQVSGTDVTETEPKPKITEENLPLAFESTTEVTPHEKVESTSEVAKPTGVKPRLPKELFERKYREELAKKLATEPRAEAETVEKDLTLAQSAAKPAATRSPDQGEPEKSAFDSELETKSETIFNVNRIKSRFSLRKSKKIKEEQRIMDNARETMHAQVSETVPKSGTTSQASSRAEKTRVEPAEDNLVLYLGIDLGTSETTVAASNGVVETVQSVVGKPKDLISQKLLKKEKLFVLEALRNRLALNIYRPLEKGVIKDTEADLEAARDLVKYVISLAHPEQYQKVYAVIGAPARSSFANQQALMDAAREVVNAVMIVSEPFAVAYGVAKIYNALIIDIGAGTIDICCLKGTMPEEEDQFTLSKAGDHIDVQLMEAIQTKIQGAQVTKDLAKKWKEEYSFLIEPEKAIVVQLTVEGKPAKVDITKEIRTSCESIMPDVVTCCKNIVANFNPEFQEELKQNIILAGGGSLIRHIDQYLERQLRSLGALKVSKVNDPIEAGAKGALILAKDLTDDYWRAL